MNPGVADSLSGFDILSILRKVKPRQADALHVN